MSKTARYIINSISAILLAGGLVGAFLCGSACRAPLTCTGLNVRILDSTVNKFVTGTDVKKYLDKEYGTYIGLQLDSIDLCKVEKIVDSRSAVLKSEAFTTRDGKLNVTVTQRTPIVRFQRNDGGFYADAKGYLFPLQSSYASRVQIIDGEIPLKANSGYKGMVTDPKEQEWLDKVLDVVNYMESSKVWKDKIVQITVCDGGELKMVPRRGKEVFLFGQPVNIEDKFSRMEMYYSNIIPAKGAETYTSVSVEYDGQIVCK
jgi:cell division protein FtsQ